MSAPAQNAVMLAFPQFPLIRYREALYDAASGSTKKRLDAEHSIGLKAVRHYFSESAKLEQGMDSCLQFNSRHTGP